MTLILIAIVGSTVLGLICRGRLGRLNRPPLARGGFILIALLGQVVAMLAHSEGVLLMWLIGSVLAAALYYLANRGRLGLLLVILGFGLNALCAALNSALPMSIDAAHRAGLAVTETQLAHEYVAEPINDSTVVPWLGQIIPIPLPHWSTVATVGDATAAAGFALFMFTGVTGRGRTIPKTPEEEKAEKKEGRAQRRKARADAKAGKTVTAPPEFPLDFHDEESDRRAATRSRELIGAGVATSAAGATKYRDGSAAPGEAETPSGKSGRNGRKGRERKAGKGTRDTSDATSGAALPASDAEGAPVSGKDAVRARDALPAPTFDTGAPASNGSGPTQAVGSTTPIAGGAAATSVAALAAEATPTAAESDADQPSGDGGGAPKKNKKGLTKAERVEARRAKKAANAAKAAAAAAEAAVAAEGEGAAADEGLAEVPASAEATTSEATTSAATTSADGAATSEGAGPTDIESEIELVAEWSEEQPTDTEAPPPPPDTETDGEAAVYGAQSTAHAEAVDSWTSEGGNLSGFAPEDVEPEHASTADEDRELPVDRTDEPEASDNPAVPPATPWVD